MGFGSRLRKIARGLLVRTLNWELGLEMETRKQARIRSSRITSPKYITRYTGLYDIQGPGNEVGYRQDVVPEEELRANVRCLSGNRIWSRESRRGLGRADRVDLCVLLERITAFFVEVVGRGDVNVSGMNEDEVRDVV